MAAASLAFAGPANATVTPVSCPTNGVTIVDWPGANNYCYAGVGVLGIHINVPDKISSNWNHGYSNYYYGIWQETCQCVQDIDTSRTYYANGVVYYYDNNSDYAYSVVISS